MVLSPKVYSHVAFVSILRAVRRAIKLWHFECEQLILLVNRKAVIVVSRVEPRQFRVGHRFPPLVIAIYCSMRASFKLCLLLDRATN